MQADAQERQFLLPVYGNSQDWRARAAAPQGLVGQHPAILQERLGRIRHGASMTRWSFSRHEAARLWAAALKDPSSFWPTKAIPPSALSLEKHGEQVVREVLILIPVRCTPRPRSLPEDEQQYPLFQPKVSASRVLGLCSFFVRIRDSGGRYEYRVIHPTVPKVASPFQPAAHKPQLQVSSNFRHVANSRHPSQPQTRQPRTQSAPSAPNLSQYQGTTIPRKPSQLLAFHSP